ncbi:mechanosensitive ion channel protein [Acidobacteria bacterium Mor1]|nr:mechanosensitive ion channel protein [Acidobacteria bacterium Mor1]
MSDFDLSKLTQQMTELVSTWGLQVVGAIVVLILGLVIAKIVRSSVRGMLRRAKMDETLIPFLSNLVYYMVLAFVGIAVLGLFGIPTTSFIAVLGAAGLAVGLALQGTLSNFAAGVMLLFFRPFRVGDYVEAGGDEGEVRQVGVFASTLLTLDNVTIVLPNAAIWGAKIRNYTDHPNRRNDLAIGISYGDDINKARQVISDVLKADDRVLQDPAPLIAVSGLGDSSVDLLVGPYCKPEHYWDLRFDMYQKIKEGLDQAGVTIPFPQRDVHLFRENS